MLDDSFQAYVNFSCVSEWGNCPNKAKKSIISFLKLPSLSPPLLLSFSLSSNSFSLHLQRWQKSETQQEILLIIWVEYQYISPSSGLGCNSTPRRRFRLHIIIIIIIFFSAASALFAHNWRRCLSPSLSPSPCTSLCHHKAKKNNLTTRQWNQKQTQRSKAHGRDSEWQRRRLRS